MTLLSNLLLFIFLLVLLLASVSDATKCDIPAPDLHGNEIFYVDVTTGNDAWDGRFVTYRKNNNGPFRSIEGAVSYIRRHRADNQRTVTLFVLEGDYVIDGTITIDSRIPNLEIVGYPPNTRTPRIMGGYKVPGSSFEVYKSVGDLVIYSAPISGSCSSHVFIGDKRLLRARKPNIFEWTGNDLTGSGPYLYIKGLLQETPDCNMRGSGGFKQRNCPEKNKEGFEFHEGDIDPTWGSLLGGEVLVLNAWTAQRGSIAEVDDGKVFFRQPLRIPIGQHPKPSGFRVVLENVKEVLDAVGEFYCDPEEKRLYVIPPDGALEHDDVFVAKTSVLFRLREAANVTFSDLELTFSHDSNFAGYNTKPGAVLVDRSVGVRFNRCQFTHIGYTGLFVYNSVGLEVTNCVFKDIGYHGISVAYNHQPDDVMATRDVTIDHNTFRGCGVSNMYQPCCILVKGIRNIHVTNNDVSLSSYAAIRVGWQKVFTLDHVTPGEHVFYVTHNHIWNYGRGILNDFAGVYLSSNMRDCGEKQNMSICHIHALIEHNVIHDSKSYLYGAMGIYGDTAVSSLTVRRNWMYKLSDTAINFHCGQKNLALNNVINHGSRHRVFGACNGAVGPGGIPRQELTFRYNVIHVNQSNPMMYGRGDTWRNDVPDVDHNDYYFVNTPQANIDRFFPKGISFQQWRSDTGNDISSIIADPMFVDIDNDDYRLQENSPALKLGIKSVDLGHVITNSGACQNEV